MIGSRSRAFRILYPCNRLCHFSKKLNTDIKPKTIWARNHLPFSSRTRLSSSLAEFGPPPSPPTTPILDEKENAGGQQATSPFLDELNPSQLQAVVQPLNAIIRVISGPGSGKTRVLTSRMAYLLQHDPDPRKRILGVTFTRKAAGEMQERLEQLVPDLDMLSNRVTLGTFHSICAKLLRWNGDVLSTLPSVQRDMYGSSNSTILNGDFTIIDEAEQLRILNTCLEQEKISLQESPLKPRTILGRFSDYKEKRSEGGKGSPPSQDSRPISFTEQIVAKVYPLYRENLLSRNSLDFDDLIVLTRDLLLHHSDRRERFQQHWTHVLVDEFQDTSKAQVDLVKLWTSSSLLVVGDADQSIYSWRGAHVSSLADFADEFAQWGKVETVFLMENYRSTSNIIKAAQKVISYQPSGTDSSGADRLRQNMKPKRGAGPPPRVVRFENETAEAKFVIKTVKDAWAVGNYTDSHTVAFIYRTNAQSRALEEACVQENLPYVIFGSATSFYKRLEIKDCLCFLRWLLNGRDKAAMVRALTTPKRGIGDSALRELDDYCVLVESYQKAHPDVTTTLWTPLDVLISLAKPQQNADPAFPLPQDTFSTRSLKVFTEFAWQMQTLRTLAYQQPLAVVLRSVIDTMELMPHFNKASKTNSEFEDRKQNVEELQQATQKYTNRGPCLATPSSTLPTDEQPMDVVVQESPLRSFLDDVALVTDLAERSADERFVVNLMTIHASKGKEFDTVFVVGNEEGTFPTSQAIQSGEQSTELEEEKRLCYVAMTRAKTELFLTWRKEVSVFTKEGIRTITRHRSRFLNILVGKKPNEEETSELERAMSSRRPPNSATVPRKTLSAKTERSYTSTSERSRVPYREWQSKPKPVVVPPKVNNREGTTSVYAAKAAPLAVKPGIPSSSSRPLSGRSQSVSPRSGVAPPRPSSTPPKPSTPTGQQRIRSTILPNTVARSIDSTLFFPIGSTVVHKTLGRGIVQPKPPPTGGGTSTDGAGGGDNNAAALAVYVRFAHGPTRQFSAAGKDLVPALD